MAVSQEIAQSRVQFPFVCVFSVFPIHEGLYAVVLSTAAERKERVPLLSVG
jgi:hypothetical protein